MVGSHFLVYTRDRSIELLGLVLMWGVGGEIELRYIK